MRSRLLTALVAATLLVAGVSAPGTSAAPARAALGPLATAPTAVSPSGVSPLGGRAAVRAAIRPNVVVITTDDMAASDLRWMPRTRSLLGDAGITFENAIAENPLCCPSRATFLTGQESHNNQVWSNSGPRGGYVALRKVPRLPVWLQQAGYRTAMVGKHLNGYNPRYFGPDPGWHWFDPLIKNVYNYTHFTSYRNGRPVTVKGGYTTSYVGASTRRAIRRFERRDQAPFFVWTSFVAPHRATTLPCPVAEGCWDWPQPDPRDVDRYPKAVPPSLASDAFNEADMSDKPGFMRDFPLVAESTVRAEFLARIRSLAAVDRAVAGIVRSLADHGELSRTLVVFTSDNGFQLGEHRHTGKVLPYEESLRVPLLVRGPGVARGGVARGAVTTADLTRTIVALSGARPQYALDGASMLRTLRDPGRRVRSGTLIQSGGDGIWKPLDQWLYRGYRDARYTYAVYHGGFQELYDRRRDPWQLTSVVGDPRYADVLTQAHNRMLYLRKCRGDACSRRFPPLPPPTE